MRVVHGQGQAADGRTDDQRVADSSAEWTVGSPSLQSACIKPTPDEIQKNLAG